ncbi:MAG: SWIM zinc finger family protein [Nanoarchaeota archaeon]|nr:SWIM zinc finger family protein [Nanoarchaeota archaeon]
MHWDYFPKAAPRPKPKPGKARKNFGETWWGKKWVESLSDFEYDQRMARGRAYARAEMVKNFKVDEGNISAAVKGSMGNYKVSINFNKFSKQKWNGIIKKLGNTPIIAGKLLNNEMPERIDEVAGCSFVPNEFKAKCSCPDYANPCKHIAAVFYTLADEIDYEPMMLFKLRGMSKESLFKEMGILDNKEEEPAAKKPVKKGRAKKKPAKVNRAEQATKKESNACKRKTRGKHR